jgi:hypothetical protein
MHINVELQSKAPKPYRRRASGDTLHYKIKIEYGPSCSKECDFGVGH